jgi:hypothetical protein
MPSTVSSRHPLVRTAASRSSSLFDQVADDSRHDLLIGYRCVYLLVLLAEHYKEGKRQKMAMALTGTLLNAGWPRHQATGIVSNRLRSRLSTRHSLHKANRRRAGNQ